MKKKKKLDEDMEKLDSTIQAQLNQLMQEKMSQIKASGKVPQGFVVISPSGYVSKVMAVQEFKHEPDTDDAEPMEDEVDDEAEIDYAGYDYTQPPVDQYDAARKLRAFINHTINVYNATHGARVVNLPINAKLLLTLADALPTSGDLPQTDADNRLRAIEALLRSQYHGEKVTKEMVLDSLDAILSKEVRS